MKNIYIKGSGDGVFKCICSAKQISHILKDQIKIFVSETEAERMSPLGVFCCMGEENFDAIIHIMDDNNQPRLLENTPSQYIYYFSQIFSIDDSFFLAEVEKFLFDNKLYKQLKMFNKLKIDVAVATKNTVADYMPRYLHISHTNFCNAQCIMCTHYFLKNKHAKHLDERMLEKFDELLPYAEILTLHGTGEPFMDKSILKTLAACEKYGVQIVTNTNLSYLSPELFGYVSRIFRQLNVSCDGANKEIFEEIRKNISFETFEKNLALLNTVSDKVLLCMASVAMRQNILHLTDLVLFAKKYGFKRIAFNCLKAYKEIGNYDDELINYPNVSSRSFKECLKVGREIGIEVLVPEDMLLDCENDEQIAIEIEKMNSVASSVSVNMQEELSEKNKDMELTEIPQVYEKQSALYNCQGICDWLAEKPYIDIDGNVAICCFNKNVIVGNVFETPIKEIINSPVYKTWRQAFYDNKMPMHCGHCQFVQNGTLERLKVYDKK